MPRATVAGLSIAYELIGDAGARPWVVMPGGRLGKDCLGIRELGTELAAGGYQAVIWDRPNTGESDVCFRGESESVMHADVLAGLLGELGLTGALVSGGSAGARVSLLAAARHPDVIGGMAIWWVSGGVYGFINLGVLYCSENIRAAWNGGMEAVAALPEWQEVLERNPANRARFLAQDPKAFVETFERWMMAYCPCDGNLQPGVPDADLRGLDRPALIFRSGASDPNHTRATSERLAALLPNSRMVEPPWLDTEWIDRRAAGEVGFVRWPRLAPQMLEWADGTFASP